jgi:hypothetical protein
MNELYKERIKKELKNSIPDGQITTIQHLLIINQAIKELLITDNKDLDKVSSDYWKAQEDQELIQGNAQKKIIKNAEEVFNFIMGL